MYKKFFGLRENPFNVNPDPRFLFHTPETQEALACLMYGIKKRRGFILLTGEVGTGKHESRLKSQMLIRLNQWLLERYRAGEPAVLIVDEAQNLSPDVLEEIRLLTNLETSTEKLLQIVLSGQPELEVKLNQPQLRQVRQRIVLRCKTYPLTLEQVCGYVAERLRIAGCDGQPIFAPEAVEALHQHTGGIPRVINLLCEHALISAMAKGQRPVPASVVEEVAREFELQGAERSATSPVRGGSNHDDSGNSHRPRSLQLLGILMDRLRRPE